MSHFTTIQVHIKDGEILSQVLEELGYEVERDAAVRGYQGDRTYAEFVIRQDNGYDLGFRLNGNNYELVADFWGVAMNQKTFVNQVSQKYAHKMLLSTVQDQGFTVEAEEILPDGTVRVLVGRWA
ncbi:hypothetical protein BST81_05925 [Leptolyngbya sp. 'hensonii']|uniref:DUF1257 domain-containing protein n=1 Tax=Leptolyngbya sp. 'hensonii' TaxID=1922337 RepID=UPI00094F7A1A|nr:DUF1257 domain-containing protein [Leptolyngbya sp. 'hensonii']OLP19294.1 hypothetical protein BST81_05925 [Leptolyngbya sp. 'hensonii']